MLRGAGIIFFAYIGFDAVSTAAQEARNPERDMPIGILGSLAICTVLYIAAVLVLTGIVPFRQLNVPDPLALAIDSTPLRWWLSPIVKIGALLGTTAVILVMMLGQTRVFYSMAHDGLLPKPFGKIHSRVSDPLHQHRPDRSVRGPCRGAVAPANCGRTGEHRHPAGLCHCVGIGRGNAQDAPGNSPAFPHALRVGWSGPWA